MSAGLLRVLILDDVPADAELVERELRKIGSKYSWKWVDSREAFLKELRDFAPNLILSDYSLPQFDGLAALTIARDQCPDVPFILVSGAVGEELAIELLRKGATDYVLKSNLKRLVPSVIRALQEATERAEYKRLKEERDRLFSLSIDMLAIVGFDGRFKQVNPAWTTTLGWTNEELMSRPYLDFVYQRDRDSTSSIARDLEKGRPIVGFENRYVCKDGSHKWISWNSFPLPEKQLIFAVARDVTQQKDRELEHIKHVKKLEEFYDIAVGRELRMKELVGEIAGLRRKLEEYKKT